MDIGIGIIIWTVVIVVIVFLILGFLLISRIKLILKKDMDLLNDRLKSFRQHMEDADLIINEINILSDYAANEIEKANDKFSESISELNNKVIDSKKVSNELRKILNECNLVVEKYSVISNNLSPTAASSKYMEESIEEDKEQNIKDEFEINELETKIDVQILELYNQGRDIRDIAKKLNIGQREVKLIIDIHNDANNN